MTLESQRLLVRIYHAEISAWEGEADSLAALLSPEEIDRSRRFARPELVLRYVVAHGLLRLVLSRETGVPLTALRLISGPAGKPVLAPEHPPLAFNLSHSEDHVVIGTSSANIGVDIEAIRPLPDEEAVAGVMMTAGEYARWQVLQSEERLRYFYWVWTIKEACVKESGEGLAIEPRSLETGTDGQVRGAGRSWHAVKLDAGPECAAAVALRDGPFEVSQERFHPPLSAAAART